MAGEYQQAFDSFQSLLEDGLSICNSGYTGKVFNAQEFYDNDVCAEESWSNHLDSEGLELLVSLEDCLTGTDLEYVLENSAYESFINGNLEDFKNEYSELCPVEFETYIEQNLSEKDQLKVCKWLIIHYF